MYTILTSPVCATFLILDLITLITFDEEYKLWCSSLCNFVQPPVTSTLTHKHSPQYSVLRYSVLQNKNWTFVKSFVGTSSYIHQEAKKSTASTRNNRFTTNVKITLRDTNLDNIFQIWSNSAHIYALKENHLILITSILLNGMIS
jgi:hypothetical protein